MYTNHVRANFADSCHAATGSGALQSFKASANLPARITWAASKQTYYTIRFLVDRDRVSNAYRAYSYFRWVDDWIDHKASDHYERLVFAERQEALVDWCYRNKLPCNLTSDLSDEERLLVD